MILTDEAALNLLKKMRARLQKEVMTNINAPYDSHYELQALDTAINWHRRLSGADTTQ